KTRDRESAAERDECGGAGEDRGPEQDRALEGRPEADDRVEERGFARVVLRDVKDREIVRREREHHRERRDHDESEGKTRGDPCRREHSGVAPPRRVDRRTRTPERKEQRRAQGGRAEV